MEKTDRPSWAPVQISESEGNKSRSLLQLQDLGAQVPAALVISPACLDHWIQSFEIYPQAIQEWRRLRTFESAIPKSLWVLRESILKAKCPDDWEQTVSAIARSLPGTKTLIIRSDMNFEDGTCASLAGTFKSVRCGLDPAELWAAFQTVIASAYTAEAVLQILNSGFDPKNFHPGILIQKFIEAKAAGVCFSRAPSQPWKSEGLVEWNGSGSSVVDGTIRTFTANETEGTPEELKKFWTALWAMARRAEKKLKAAADLEWAWDGQTLWFLQMRAVATEESRLVARTKPGKVWSRELTQERFPKPLTPMGWTILEGSLITNLESLDRHFGIVVKNPEDMAVCVGGTVYSDPKFFNFPKNVKLRWLRCLSPFKPAFWKILWASLQWISSPLTRRTNKVSRAFFQLEMAHAFLHPAADRLEREWDAHCEKMTEEIRAFHEKLKEKQNSLDRTELLKLITEFTELSLKFMEPDLAIYLIKTAAFNTLEALWTGLGNAKNLFLEIAGAFAQNITLSMTADWNRLITALRNDPGLKNFAERLSRGRQPEMCLGSRAAREYRNFLKKYGHRRTSWDVYERSWRENPGALAGAIVNSAENQSATTHRHFISPGRWDAFLSQVRFRINKNASERAELWLGRLENFMKMDEDHHFWSELLLEPTRDIIVAGGRLLCSAGVLENPDDVFFLTFEEMKNALANPDSTMAFLARRRQAQWMRATRATPPPELGVISDAITGGETSSTIDGKRLEGRPMSAGCIEGFIHIAENLEDAAAMKPGSILFTPSPNPALAALFPLCAGLISETGGPLSHGFVAAREFRLPAVSGAAPFKDRLRNGVRVRVNGDTGEIHILDGTPS